MKIIIVASLLVALCPGSQAGEPDKSGLTLEDVFRAAVERTEVIPIENAKLIQSQARVDQVRGRFWPNVALGAAYALQDTRPDSSSESTQRTVSLGLNQSIYAGGRDIADLNAGRLLTQSQENVLQAARDALYAGVAQVFYEVLAAEQDAENIRKSITLTRERIAELKKRVRIGRSRKIEVLAAEAQYSVLNSQLVSINGQIAASRNRFAQITGLDDRIELVDRTVLPAKGAGIESYLVMIEQRPDIRALQYQYEASQNSVGSAKAGHYPSLNLKGNYYLLRSGSQNGINWDASLGLTFPLFSGGIVSAQVREETGRELVAELLLKQKRRQAEAEILEAYNNFMSASEQVKSLEEALVATEQNYKEQLKDYSYSLAQNLDVIQAQNTFLDTKRTLDRTRFQVLAAWSGLAVATSQVSRQGARETK